MKKPSSDLPAPITGFATDLHVEIAALIGYCRHQGWSGHDPYDALNSRLLRGIGLLSSHYPRLAVTQFLKRCPVNLRGLLGVPREQNPKGIAVFLAATVRLHRVGQASATEVRELATRLLELRSPNQKLRCWGYNFDWQTRTYLVPKFTPNIICSTFAANALLDAYETIAEPAWLEAALGVGEFLLRGLNTTRDGETLCFSYTPLDRGQIHNASLLGAAVLARLHAHRASEVFRSAAVAATRFSLARQRPDGSWPYGESAKQQWIDGFHTGYNLMALERIRRSVDWPELRAPIQQGYRFYLDHFFESDGRAKYFHNRTWPIDAHSVAQALITLSGLAEYDPRSLEVAGNVCRWALQNMRAPGGWFYYQKWPLWTNRISYMRWTQSWMLLGLATMQESLAAGSTASVGSTGAR